MRIFRPVVDTVEGVGGRVRDLARLQSVASVLVKYGLGALVDGIPGSRLVKSEPFESSPERVVALLQDLGPTFVKLGQVLSTRADMLPEQWCTALSRLQDQVAPMPFSEVTKQLKEAFPDGYEDLNLRQEPLATASIAQVHRGTLPDGTRVVMKIQRPGLKRVIESDLHILRFLAGRAVKEYPELGSFDITGVLNEFEASIRCELDFIREAKHMVQFQRNFKDSKDVVIPKVYEQWVTKRVLTMDFLDGAPLRRARELGCDMKVVGDRYLTAAYDMLFIHGLFHGDLHPGNVIVLPGDRIGLLDFGMVGRMNQRMRDNVVSILFALQRGDFRTIARLFYDIAIKDERLDYKAIERETIEVMERHWQPGMAMKDVQIGPYILDLMGRASRQGCRIPSAYTMFFKAVMTSEGLAKSLIEEIDPIEAIGPYFQRMLAQRLSSEALQKEAHYALFTSQELVNRLPISISQFLDDLDAQRISFTVRHDGYLVEERGRDRRINRTLIVSTAWVWTALGTGLLFTGFPGWILGALLLSAAMPMYGLAAWMALRNRG